MSRARQTTPIDDLLARPRSAIDGRCVVCRTICAAGLDEILEFVAKRGAAGIVAGETRLLPYLAEKYGATFCVASLRRHMTRCCSC